jgi:dipeptidyl aminopeptidase/acylaminoacyl peptidase
VYFVRGIPGPFDMDIWRVPASGGKPERLTEHHAGVAYLTFLDARTLLYTVTRADGDGSALYSLNVDRRIPHAVSFGLEEYRSIDASADGRRLVATVARSDRNLWTVPISDRIEDETAARRYRVPSVRAAAPRFGRDYVLYLASRGGSTGLWKFKGGVETEIWRGADGAVSNSPAISPDGSRICFAVRREGRSRLYVMGADGTSPQALAEGLDIRDAPCFSPDGKWIAAVATRGGETQPLFRVPVEGGAAEQLTDGVAYAPVWSPDGRFIVYAEGRQGRLRQLKAVTPDRRPYPLPELAVPKNTNPFRFTPDGKALVVIQGETPEQDFWRIDLPSNRLTRLTALKPGFEMRSFDISPDGRQILFDRYRENPDLVLIDLPRK